MSFFKKRGRLLLLILLTTYTPLWGQNPYSLDSFLSKISTTPTTENTTVTPIKQTKSAPSPQTQSRINTISFSGLELLNEATIRSSLTIKEGDIYNAFKLERNIKSIESLGWFSNVDYTAKESNDTTNIHITLKENEPVKKVKISGNRTYTDDELFELIQTKEGEVYNLNTARKDIERIEEKYDENGYLKAKVIQLLSPEKNEGNLEFVIAEGVIENFSITGNRRTQDYVIIRELELRPGQTLKDTDIRENLRRVYNLNYFTEVKPIIRPSRTSANAYDVELELVEKETTGSFSFGGGYGPTSGFSLFSDLLWDNVMGTGQLLMLKGNFGLGTGNSNRSSTYQFKYHNPWMWDKRKSFTFRTWLTDGSFNSINPLSSDSGFSLRSERRRGFDVAIGIPHTYDFRSSHKVKYESIVLPSEQKNYNIYSYTLGLSHDTRDFRANPREGHYNTISIEQGFKFRLKALEFTRADLTLRKFIPTFKKQTIGLKADYGYLRSPELSDSDKFRSMYYNIGGSYTVRGYPDFLPFAYGNSQATYSIEYRFLFQRELAVYLFADAGYAAFQIEELQNFNNYKIGKGIGVKFNLPPLGPIRLDFGVDELGESRIHFNIGHAF